MAKKNYKDWSKEDLIAHVQKLEKRKKYGLVWDEERTREVFELQAQNSLPVLEEVPDYAISTNPEQPTHILIEGDNYHALSVLNYTHEKAVDVIYIDPPYNTGAKDWKYNNDYVDDEDAWRHSKWLSFMDNRLQLAKRLLKPSGVLICAIDENEHATLGLLLAEIFPDYEITIVTIVHNPRGIQGNNFAHCNEFAYFVYPKGGVYIGRKLRLEEEQEFENLRNWGGESTREYGKSLFYPIYFKDGKVIKVGDVPSYDFHPKKAYRHTKDGVLEIWPIDNNGVERKWRYSRESLSQITDRVRIEQIGDYLQVQLLKSEDRYKTVWTDTKYDANIYGTQLLKEILGREFPFPKSLYNVKECLYATVGQNKTAIVLDFFAGSGTTAHAVMELNRDDNGNRQCILVTNNENNIMTEVCYPRECNVVEGYKFTGKDKKLLFEEKLTLSRLKKIDSILLDYEGARKTNEENFDELKGEFKDNTLRLWGINNVDEFKEGLGGNIKYFRTSFVPAEPSDENKELLTRQSVEMLCLREGTFDFVTETDIWKIFKSKKHYTAILFDQLSIPDLKAELETLDKPVSVYVFSLEDDNFANEFADMKDKVKVCSIPEAILRVYRRIYQ
ncbi:MAG: site-specific DNA-methyltransferase [Anaerolineales bacterium]|nr:site-specific DNA-methyltransferase [Anaerolineales bacterium]